MEEKPDFEKDLASIRNMMDRSAKFISLSGLSGVLAGAYALAASYYVYAAIYDGTIPTYDVPMEINPLLGFQLISIGAITLVASIVTGLYLSVRKAKRLGLSIWNSTSERLIINLSIPLTTGGVFAILTIYQGYYGFIAPICLLFYGLALINASQNLFNEARYLGYCEIILGLVSTYFIDNGLLFWAIGFGVLHIVYGVVMYRKYDA